VGIVGIFKNREIIMEPKRIDIPEPFVKIAAGSQHFVGLGISGTAYTM